MVAEKTTVEILRTKLHRPPTPRDHVHRSRLLDVLNNADSRPLTLVAAPAGYGKSSLISCWLASCDWPSAWVSLDESDNNLRQFLSYFLGAIATIDPDTIRSSLSLLDAPVLPAFPILLTRLANDLDRMDQDFFLVLDDFHHIKDKSIHHFVSNLLRNPPPSMHLVVICRRYPLMPLATFRSQDKLLELGTKDLCFTEEETRLYLENFFGVEINEATAKVWTEKTEGWITALRLGAIGLGTSDNVNNLPVHLKGTSMNFMEYFLTEVLSHLPRNVRDFLMEISILDRFCAPLCEEVCSLNVKGTGYEEILGGKGLIDFLLHANLFLIPLDSQNFWFRLHHMFQQLMQEHLKTTTGPSKIKKLHSRASKWYDQKGFVEEALRHALTAGDTSRAVRLLGRHGHTMMNNQQWPRLERCLGMLPRDCVNQDPELLLLEAWVMHIRLDMPAVVSCLEQVEPLLNNLPDKTSASATQMKAHFDTLHAFQCYMAAEGENARKRLETACEKIPSQHKRARVFANIFRLATYQMMGDLEAGLTLYTKEMQRSNRSDDNYSALYMTMLNFVYWIDADLIALRNNSELSLKKAISREQSEPIALSLYFGGITCYHQNNLQIAEEKLTTMVQSFNFYHPVTFVCSAFVLALIQQRNGKTSEARKGLKDLMEYATDANDNNLLQLTQALNAELALRQGRFAEASAWAKHFHAKPFLPPYYCYMPQLTLIKSLMAQNTTGSKRKAIDILNQLNDFLASIHNNVFQIHVLALQAIHYDTMGKKPAALKKLTEALKLAEPGGFIRLFVDLGPQMRELLKNLARKNISKNYIGKILAAFREDEQRVLTDESTHPTVHQTSLRSQSTGEHLTNREMEILHKLKQRQRDKEIAEQLFISPQTVKTHLKNIYSKLGASNRIQVVSIARERGIL